MKYAILGDIHSNLSALETVLAHAREHRVDQVISVGDVVGYGAAPSECMALLRAVDAVVVKGNHDAACIGEIDDVYFNNYARAAVRWTSAALTREEKLWLRSLPMTATLEHCEVAHGSFAEPEEFNYVMTAMDADSSLDAMTTPVCFVGHTHLPVVLWRTREDPSWTRQQMVVDIDLGAAVHSLVNVGSVGQPRDEDARTGYVQYDSDEGTVVLQRMDYDIDCEAERIRRAGLPDVLASRLFLGL